MDAEKEYLDIIDGLRARLELLRDAGVREVPLYPVETPGPVCIGRAASCLDGAAPPLACPVHRGWKGVFFGLWGVGRALVVWGATASSDTFKGSTFTATGLAQLDRMMTWLAKETNASFDIGKAVYASSAGCASAYSEAEAVSNCLPFIDETAAKAAVVIAMGELPVRALLGSVGVKEARGMVHGYRGARLVATHGPDEVGKSHLLKKEAHEDLLNAIQELTRP